VIAVVPISNRSPRDLPGLGGGHPEREVVLSVPSAARRKRRLWAILAVYVAGLCVWDILAAASRGPSLWELQESARLWEWVGNLALRGMLEVVRFVPAGLLVGLAVRADRGDRVSARRVHMAASVPDADSGLEKTRPWGTGPWSFALGMIVTVGLAALVHGVALRRLPPWGVLVLPVLGGCLGLWIGWMWRGGGRARMWLAGQLVLLAAAAVLGGWGVVRGALDDQALSFTPTPVTSAGKRQVVAAIRNHEVPGADFRRWQLTEDEVNFLLAWGLSLGSSNRKAHAELDWDQMVLQASLGVPGGARPRYLNLQVAGWGEVVEGRASLRLQELRLGRIRLPSPLVRVVESLVLGMLVEDQDLAALMKSVREVRPVPGGIVISAGRGDLTTRIVSSLLGRLGNKTDSRDATREYLRHLAVAAPEFPEGEERFTAFVQAAFRLAQQRSQQGDAVRENSAAIYALGILLGHWRVEQLVGPVSDPELRARAARQVRGVTLRGRHDWSRHFWVSAALAVLSSETSSDAAGLLKEELDADGGSGFSFSDLLADRAGTLLGMAATSDDASARRVQQRLSAGVTVDVLCPPAADLPEGLSDKQFQRDYGGVGGARYRELLAEIERRCQGTLKELKR
jgi:hypothetical protein